MDATDVGVIGGGLAGLSIAIHLKRKHPSVSITLFERRELPYPEATHKVGESTVEIAAHYFSDVLGLKEHLQTAQLRKLGLRLFFTEKTNDRIEQRICLGADKHFSVPTYQIDRGRFENFLVDVARELGVKILTNSKVSDVTLTSDGTPHTLQVTQGGHQDSLRCAWVIDASGRAGLLKRSLSLQEPSQHDSNAVWFRIKGRIDIDDWCQEPSWRAGREGVFSRWYSTNHLTGEGYWVWLIPLASGYTSIGVVTDPKIHPLSRFKTFSNTLSWMQEFEPQCARELEPYAEQAADYLAIKHYAHKCTRVLSSDRWAMTGDSGVFIDPLYSPGSDFIAIQNGFIVDAITRDLGGERFIGRCEIYNDIYRQLTDAVLSTFLGQYPVFGNPRIMPLKVIWDYTIYWGFFAFFTVQQRLCDLESLKIIEDAVATIYRQSEEMQRILRSNHARSYPPLAAGFIDIAQIPFLVELNRGLTSPHTTSSFLSTLRSNIALIEDVFYKIRDIVEAPTPTWNSAEELLDLLRQIPCAQALPTAA